MHGFPLFSSSIRMKDVLVAKVTIIPLASLARCRTVLVADHKERPIVLPPLISDNSDDMIPAVVLPYPQLFQGACF